MNMILASIGVFLVVVILLVVILLVAKNFLVPSGNVKLTINGDKELDVASGSTLLNTLSVNGVFLSSACGGKGSCGQCKCQVMEGGGEILPSETPHFSRKQIQDHWRLGCQVKVKGDMAIKGSRKRTGRERVGVRGYLQQECGYVHQRVHRCFAQRRAHGFRSGFLCAD